MSKSDKKLKLTSATETKQAPLIQIEEVNNTTINDLKRIKTKDKLTPTKSKHKHDYQIVSMETWLRNTNKRGENYFDKFDNEYFTFKLKCSICGKDNKEWKRIFIDEWNEKYKTIYEKLELEAKFMADDSDVKG